MTEEQIAELRRAAEAALVKMNSLSWNRDSKEIVTYNSIVRNPRWVLKILAEREETRRHLKDVSDALGWSIWPGQVIDVEHAKAWAKQHADGLALMNSCAHILKPPDNIGPGEFIPWCKTRAAEIEEMQLQYEADAKRIEEFEGELSMSDKIKVFLRGFLIGTVTVGVIESLIKMAEHL